MSKKTDETKIRILEGAFKLFLKQSYETVTVPDLEQAIGFTRGAIFYHYPSKEDLYKAVVDYYIIRIHNQDFEFKYPLGCTSLKEFIHHYVNGVETVIKKSQQIGIENIHKEYYSFIFDAVHHYVGLEEKLNDTFAREMDFWKHIVQKAYDNKEIRQDVNVNDVAQHFRYIYSGLLVETSLKKGIDPKELLDLYLAYYNKIKTSET